jgi:uncharacterized YkwD family protein
MMKRITAAMTVLVLTFAVAVPAAFAAGNGCNGSVQALDNNSERTVFQNNAEQVTVESNNPDAQQEIMDIPLNEVVTAIIPVSARQMEIAVPDLSSDQDVYKEQQQSQPGIDVATNVPDSSAGTDYEKNQSVRPGINQAQNVSVNAMENEMFRLVNDERIKAGLKPFTLATDLTRVARMKSQDMVDNGYFSHQSPTYGSPFEMMKNNGIEYRAAGENIAKNGSVLKAHQALMNSEGHRANILNPNFTHIGIGIVKDNGQAGIVITQIFITK